MLPPYGRPGVTSGAPTGSRARFWRRGDIHVARITDAYTRVKTGTIADTRRAVVLPPYGRPSVTSGAPTGCGAVRRRDDARPCRARWTPGVTSGAPTGSRARFWRRGDIHVARMTDAYTRRAGTIADMRRAVVLPPYGRPGVTSGAPTDSRRRFWRRGADKRRGDIHVARITDAHTRVKR